MMKIFVACLIATTLPIISFTQSQEIFPQKEWRIIDNLDSVGWSTEKLKEAHAIAGNIGSDAFMVVHKGAVLTYWGDVKRKYKCHSMRKSLLSALFGIYVDKGKIRLNDNLDKLGIDDTVNPLTTLEKTATVEHLLTSRSGIYLPAAYEFPSRKPKRGKYNPGEHWYYANNWDYNALLTIFEITTDQKLFEEFYNQLATPLQMQDYEIKDGYYHFELNKSQHPAYPFRMSTRDLARIGYLFLNDGIWNDKQIISKQWIAKSTSSISETYSEGEGYGYLWWVDKKNFKYDYFSAEGAGGHAIIVIPDIQSVIVHRVNTYRDKQVTYRDRKLLISKIMDAYHGEINAEINTRAWISNRSISNNTNAHNSKDYQKYVGDYSLEDPLLYETNPIKIYLNDTGELEIFIPYNGYYEMHPITESLFQLEDSEEFISFLPGTNKTQLIYHRNSRVGIKNE